MHTFSDDVLYLAVARGQPGVTVTDSDRGHSAVASPAAMYRPIPSEVSRRVRRSTD